MKDTKNIDQLLKSKLDGFEQKGSTGLRVRFYWMIMKKRFMGAIIFLVFLLGGLGSWMLFCDDDNKQELSEFANNKEIFEKSKQNKLPEVVNESKSDESTPEKKAIEKKIQKEDVPEKRISKSSETKNIEEEIEKPVKKEKIIENHGKLTMNQIDALPSPLFLLEKDIKTINTINTGVYNDDYYLPPEERFSRFGISVSAGPNIYNHTYQHGSLNEGIYKFEAENSNPLQNINFSLTLEYRIKDFIISTGLNLRKSNFSVQLTESKQLYDPSASYYQQDTIWGYIYDPPILGKPVILGFDSTWIEVYRTDINQIQKNIQLKYVGIPLNLGYIFEQNKYYVKPWPGLNFSFLVDANGQLPLKTDKELINLDSESEYLQKFITSMHMGVELGYALKPEQYIFMSSWYQQALDATIVDYPLNRKNKQIGIELGYKINF